MTLDMSININHGGYEGCGSTGLGIALGVVEGRCGSGVGFNWER